MKEITITKEMLLGLHSTDEKTRIKVKNYIILAILKKQKFYMSFEDVGICDDYIWTHHKNKEEQDTYWPFLYYLHTHHIVRGKEQKEAEKIVNKRKEELSFPKELEILYQESLKLRINN
ncbi:hypothetical protein BVX95_02255 [archaeon D22]|nr:hypothetical protein BVX95_02255 [archaeon D22]